MGIAGFSGSRSSCQGQENFVHDTISLLSGGISMKLDTYNHHASAKCFGFQGQWSKAKVLARQDGLYRQMHSHQLMAVQPLCIC